MVSVQDVEKLQCGGSPLPDSHFQGEAHAGSASTPPLLSSAFSSSLWCFESMLFFLLFLLHLTLQIGPRGNKAKQTKSQAACQVSLSTFLSQWLVPGKPEVMILCSGFCPSEMQTITSAWWVVGEPQVKVIVTATWLYCFDPNPRWIRSQILEGSNDCVWKGDLRLNSYISTPEMKNTQGLSLPELVVVGVERALKFYFSICISRLMSRNQFSACPLV